MKIQKNRKPSWRRLPCLALATLVPALGAKAVTITYEGFDIPPGEIDNTAGDTSFGWGQDQYGLTWWGWNFYVNDFYHGVSDSGLSYPGVPSIGNAFVFQDEVRDEATSQNTSVYRKLPKFYTYNSSGQLWFSVLVNPTITGAPGGYGWFQVCLSNNQNDVYLGISNADNQVVWSGGGERLYEDGVNGAKWSYSDIPIQNGVTAFLVMHLDFDNKTAAFYANPDPTATDPGVPVAEYEMLTDMFIDKVRLWCFNNGPSVDGDGIDIIGSMVDEIRLGDTYASVAAGADLTDPGGGTVDQDPPVITGPSGDPGDTTATASVDELSVAVWTMTADETVSWSLSGGVDQAFFTIGSGTGGLSFLEYPDYENPADANGDNVYVVEVQAMDEAGNAATQEISVTVTDVADETAPVITGPSGQAGDAEISVSINENKVLVGTFTSDDASATWDLAKGADDDLFEIGADTGELRFIAVPDFENPVDANLDNVYEVEVRATDVPGNASVQLVLVSVLDVNENADTTPPVITGLSGGAGDIESTASVDENTTVVGTLSADEEVSWMVAGGADGAAFQIGIDSGELSFLQAPDFELPLDDNGDNVYIVEIEATDNSGNVSSHTVAVTVIDVQEAVVWDNWMPDAAGWINSNENDGWFMGWVNVAHEPWIYSAEWHAYLYVPESAATAAGVWAYMPLDLSDTTVGDWAYWSIGSDSWVDTSGEFIGWIQVDAAPWILSLSLEGYIYVETGFVSPTGAWMFIPLVAPTAN